MKCPIADNGIDALTATMASVNSVAQIWIHAQLSRPQ